MRLPIGALDVMLILSERVDSVARLIDVPLTMPCNTRPSGAVTSHADNAVDGVGVGVGVAVGFGVGVGVGVGVAVGFGVGVGVGVGVAVGFGVGVGVAVGVGVGVGVAVGVGVGVAVGFTVTFQRRVSLSRFSVSFRTSGVLSLTTASTTCGPLIRLLTLNPVPVL